MKRKSKVVSLFMALILIFLVGSKSAFKKAPEVKALENKKTTIVVKAKKKELKLLQKKYNNPEIVGILKIKGLNINEGVAQGNDNSFYLDHDLSKNKKIGGAVFLDSRNKLDDKQLNIYSHSSNYYNLLFNRFFKYQDENFYRKNDELQLNLNGVEKNYKIYSVIRTKTDTEHTFKRIADDEKYLKHLKRMKEMSLHKSEVSLNKEDHVVILQTCLQGKYEGWKLAIVAKRI